jgi:oxygen-dependent protoporphyrinogen oxidase
MQLLAPTKLLPILTTRLFGVQTKIRMGLEWFRRPLENPERSVAEFVRDHFGDELNEYLAQPMLLGVYGGSPEQLSADCVLPMFVAYERQYGSIARGALKKKRESAAGSLFMTLKGGLETLVEALESEIESSGEVLKKQVRQVARESDGWKLTLDDGEYRAEHVVAAVPAHEAARLLRLESPELAETLASIPYSSSITAGLVYERPDFEHPLDGFGMLIPRSEGLTLAACTWVETKFDHRVSGRSTLLRAFVAADNADKLMAAPDDEIKATTHAELSALMGFDANPIEYRVNRWRNAMALYTVGHATKVEKIEQLRSRLPGLHLGGNGYDGIGIPDCVRRGKSIADSITQANTAASSRDFS